MMAKVMAKEMARVKIKEMARVMAAQAEQQRVASNPVSYHHRITSR